MYKPKNWDLLSHVEQEAWREKKREASRKHYAANTKKVLEAGRKWCKENREKKREISRESQRKRYEANREKLKEYARKYYKANHEKRRKSDRKTKQKTRQQTAADQFFILAGAAESISKLKPKQ